VPPWKQEVTGEEVIKMAVLVAYASKHGATQQIAERIAQTLTAAGQRGRPAR
jgi:flavorubredoxin